MVGYLFQERMTVQIADTLNDVLQPKGVAVVIEGSHRAHRAGRARSGQVPHAAYTVPAMHAQPPNAFRQRQAFRFSDFLGLFAGPVEGAWGKPGMGGVS